MAVTVYTSTDVGAPTVQGTTNGSLCALFDAILVGTSGTAYGSKASLGWTLAHSATNARSYVQPSGSGGFTLNVLETASGYAQVRGYESMTSTTGGTNPYPTVAQKANSTIWKGTAAGSRTWRLYSNGNTIHFFILYAITTPFGYSSWETHFNNSQWLSFGDFKSNKPGDTFNSYIICGDSTVGSTSFTFSGSRTYAATTNCHMVRDYTGTVAGAKTITVEQLPWGNGTYGSHFAPQYNGSLQISPMYIKEVTGAARVIRGRIPGLYMSPHPDYSWASFKDSVPLTAISGKVFEKYMLQNTQVLFIETTGDAW